jgi:hypothetical protein
VAERAPATSVRSGPNADVRKDLRPGCANDAVALIAIAQVAATEFAQHFHSNSNTVR